MRKIGFSLAATILTWLLFFVCAYVLLNAPQLRYFIETGYTLDWISRNYRDLGLFLGGVTILLFCIAALNTYFLVGNIRLSWNAEEARQQNPAEKPKRQPENPVNVLLESLDEDEMTELRDLLITAQDEMQRARRDNS